MKAQAVLAVLILDYRSVVMIWLQCNECFNDVAEFDETAGTWRIIKRTSEGNDIPSRTDGFYSILSSVFCALYHSSGELFVQMGDVKVKLSNNVEIAVNGPPGKRCLSLMVSGHEFAKHEYALISQRIEGDPTAFVEDEDFDFGVFLSNIARTPKRQSILKGEA